MDERPNSSTERAGVYERLNHALLKNHIVLVMPPHFCNTGGQIQFRNHRGTYPDFGTSRISEGDSPDCRRPNCKSIRHTVGYTNKKIHRTVQDKDKFF